MGVAETTIRFLALGDSYAVGESVGPEENWPRQLTEWLAGLGRSVDGLHPSGDQYRRWVDHIGPVVATLLAAPG